MKLLSISLNEKGGRRKKASHIYCILKLTFIALDIKLSSNDYDLMIAPADLLKKYDISTEDGKYYRL